MKKILFLTAALLLCSLAHSQEAESTGSGAELTVVSRLDLNPYVGDESSGLQFNHGNSSIYTIFEGSFSEHVSWTLVNHWISTGGDYGWPYRNLGHSDLNNLVDFAYFTFSFGSWSFDLGKQMVTTGGFEYDEWDWDIHYGSSSFLWDCFACYQWGLKAGWTTPSEMSSFSLQMTTSPYGERPFSSGLYTYSAQWRGEYGWFSNIWSVSALQYDKGAFQWLASLDHRFTFSDQWNLTLGWNNYFGNQITGKLVFAPSDKFDFTLAGNYMFSKGLDTIQEEIYGELIPDNRKFSLFCQYYPLKDSQDLRIHAGVSYDSFGPDSRNFSFNVGARYNLPITLW